MSTSGLDVATGSVLVKSETPLEATLVQGPTEFSDLTDVLAVHGTVGYQATHFGRAVALIKSSLSDRLEHQQQERLEKEAEEQTGREDFFPSNYTPTHYKRFLFFIGVSANILATGCREGLVFLARHRLLDIFVVSGGGMEHDLKRILAPESYQVGGGKYSHDLDSHHEFNEENERIGNVARFTDSKKVYEGFMMKVLQQMLEDQTAKYAALQSGEDEEQRSSEWALTPSLFWNRVGEEIARDTVIPQELKESSVLYWAFKNEIPIYSPNFSDGDMGLLITRFNQSLMKSAGSQTQRPLVLDLIRDIGLLNKAAMKAKKTAMLILGGGIIKHHVCNANLMRNGADYAVFVNNAQEYDGSDAGAKPDEAVSWGKIRLDGKSTKIYGEVSLVFPLLVASAFLPFLASTESDVK